MSEIAQIILASACGASILLISTGFVLIGLRGRSERGGS